MEMVVAFQLGAYPSMTGVHFNIMEILRRAQNVGGEVGRRVEEHAKKLLEMRKATAGNVLFVESLLDRVNLAHPPRPQTYDEFQRWASQVAKEALAAAKADVYETQAYFLGYNLGDVMLTLRLHAVVDNLKEVMPTDEFLVTQAHVLTAGESKARKNLEMLAQSPAFHEPVLALVRDVTGTLTALDRPNPERDQLFSALLQKAADIAKALTPVRPQAS